MRELLTEWMINLTLVSLLSSLITKLLPGKEYTPYIRVFCGILMILTLLQPMLKLTGLENEIDFHLTEDMYEIEKRQMENKLIRIEEEQKEKLKNQYEEYLEEQLGGMENED